MLPAGSARTGASSLQQHRQDPAEPHGYRWEGRERWKGLRCVLGCSLVLSPRPRAWLCTLAIAPLWLHRATLSGSQRRKANAITHFQILPATCNAQMMPG